MAFYNAHRQRQRLEQRVRCERCHFPTRVNPPPPPQPRPAAPPEPPKEMSPEGTRSMTLFFFVMLCLKGPLLVYTFRTIGHDLDDDDHPFVFVLKLFALVSVIPLSILGALGFLFGCVCVVIDCTKTQDSAVKTVPAEALEEGGRRKEDDGEKVEADDQQEMVELLTTQRGYATFDDIV